MIVFGGEAEVGGSLQFSNAIHTLEFSPTPHWTSMDAGPGPLGRLGHAAVLHPSGNQLVVVGGEGLDASGTRFEFKRDT